MESLAAFVSAMLLVMLLLAATTVTLSILTRLEKLPPYVGYIALGVQVAETVFAYQLSQVLFGISLALVIACALIMFIPKKAKA